MHTSKIRCHSQCFCPCRPQSLPAPLHLREIMLTGGKHEHGKSHHEHTDKQQYHLPDNKVHIGTGSYSKVYRCRINNEDIAAKVIPITDSDNKDLLLREVQVMKKMWVFFVYKQCYILMWMISYKPQSLRAHSYSSRSSAITHRWRFPIGSGTAQILWDPNI